MFDIGKIHWRDNRILVRLDKSPRTTQSGLIIGEAPMEDGHEKIYPQVGVVVAIGDAVSDISVGDRILTTKYDGVFIEGFPRDMKVMREDRVEAIIESGASIVVEWGAQWGK